MDTFPRHESIESRREALKKVGKTASFVIPTMMTFKASALKACPSKPPKPRAAWKGKPRRKRRKDVR